MPKAEEIEIKVPASVANLGPGLDTLAVAVQLYLKVRVKKRFCDHSNELEFSFIGQQLAGENYIERAFRYLAAKDGGSFPALKLEVRPEIPMCSGLGSSAAATIAGLKLYEAIMGPRSAKEILNAACELEGHPDNAAAALYGGLTGSCQLPDGTVAAISSPWPESVVFVVLTPEVHLETKASRKALPDKIPRADAVFNLQRVVLLLQALQSRDYRLLKEALRDRWHQPYRQSMVPGLEEALALEHPDLLGVCLSGAGPSIVALAEKNVPAVEALLSRAYAPLRIPYRIRTLRVHQNTSVCQPVAFAEL